MSDTHEDPIVLGPNERLVDDVGRGKYPDGTSQPPTWARGRLVLGSTDGSETAADSEAFHTSKFVDASTSILFLTATIVGVSIGVFGPIVVVFGWLIDRTIPVSSSDAAPMPTRLADILPGLAICLAIGVTSIAMLLLQADWPGEHTETDPASPRARPIPALLRYTALGLTTFTACALIALGIALAKRTLQPTLAGAALDIPSALVAVASCGPILLGALAFWMLPSFYRSWTRGTPDAPTDESGPTAPSMWESRTSERDALASAAVRHDVRTSGENRHDTRTTAAERALSPRIALG